MAPRAHAWSGGAPGRRPEPARRRRSGLVALQQGVGDRAFGALMRRQLQRDPKEYEQDVTIGMVEYAVGSTNVSSGVTDELVAAAQKRLAKGPIKDVKDLADLRTIALADDTVSDQERLFLAALLDPKNADRIKAVNLKSQEGRDLKLRFALDDGTTKRVREIADFGRPAAGKGDAAKQITSLAGKLSKRAAAVVKFAKERKVPLADVLEAMRMAGSDSTPGDMVSAGAIYAIAVAAGNPLADDVKAGRLKVDEMPRTDIEAAIYVPTGTGGLLKGDTIYVKPSFDVSDLLDRATAIHELEHARQDKAEGKPLTKDASELEPDAYVAGGKYTLEEIAALPEKARPAAQKKVAEKWGLHNLFAAVIAARKDADRLMPVLKAINALVKDQKLADDDFKKPDSELKERLVVNLGSHGRGRVRLSGLGGESILDLKRGSK
jgi:hypothetical protein